MVKQQENDRNCNKKGKSYSKKQGTAVITAKIGKKKYKCKVKVWQKTIKKPTKTNTEPNPIGTRVNISIAMNSLVSNFFIRISSLQLIICIFLVYSFLFVYSICFFTFLVNFVFIFIDVFLLHRGFH